MGVFWVNLQLIQWQNIQIDCCVLHRQTSKTPIECGWIIETNENGSQIVNDCWLVGWLAGWLIDWFELLLLLLLLPPWRWILLIIYSHTTTKCYRSLSIFVCYAAKFYTGKHNQHWQAEQMRVKTKRKYTHARTHTHIYGNKFFIYGPHLIVTVRNTTVTQRDTNRHTHRHNSERASEWQRKLFLNVFTLFFIWFFGWVW